ELDSRALTYRKIYESYLQAYTDTVQRQSFPGTASRVISRAEPPKRQSSPKRGLTLVASIILGSFLGVGIALVRTALDETVRSSNQLMRKIGAPLLGEIDDTP
ncbi:MAG TPA: GNVR domain-containing protein, partial [Hyphomicrobium sp.]|nr:GNVR domain-containing protein [Hyphomicrobium sp.]